MKSRPPARTLPLLDASGSIVQRPTLIMVGAMHYPECPQSMFHFSEILGQDHDLNPDRPSEIGKLISKNTASRKAQGHLAGQLALRLVEMHEHGLSPSIGKAEHLVSIYAQDTSVGGAPLRPRTLESVRKAFKTFRNVCHLWAAQIAFYNQYLAAGGGDEEAFVIFLSAAACIEDRLRKCGKPQDWNPWRIPEEFRGHCEIMIPPPERSGLGQYTARRR